MNQQSIGKYLAEKREQHNLTQNELAAKLGVKEKLVAKWEKGAKLPKSSMYEELCKTLETTPGEILAGRDFSEEEQSSEKDKEIIHFLRVQDDQTQNSWCSILFWIMIVSWIFLAIIVDASSTDLDWVFIALMVAFSGKYTVWIPKTSELEKSQDRNLYPKNKTKNRIFIFLMVALYIMGTLVMFIIPMMDQHKAEQIAEANKYIYKGAPIQELITYDRPNEYGEAVLGEKGTIYEEYNPEHKIILEDKNDEETFQIYLASYKENEIDDSGITDTSSLVSVDSDSIVEKMTLDSYVERGSDKIYYVSEYWSPYEYDEYDNEYDRYYTAYIQHGDYIIAVSMIHADDEEDSEQSKKYEKQLHKITESIKFNR